MALASLPVRSRDRRVRQMAPHPSALLLFSPPLTFEAKKNVDNIVLKGSSPLECVLRGGESRWQMSPFVVFFFVLFVGHRQVNDLNFSMFI